MLKKGTCIVGNNMIVKCFKLIVNWSIFFNRVSSIFRIKLVNSRFNQYGNHQWPQMSSIDGFGKLSSRFNLCLSMGCWFLFSSSPIRFRLISHEAWASLWGYFCGSSKHMICLSLLFCGLFSPFPSFTFLSVVLNR